MGRLAATIPGSLGSLPAVMKHEWVAYVVVAVLSIGIGVAIAGLPSSANVDPTVLVPLPTVVPAESTTPPVTEVVVTEPPETTAPPTTESETTTTVATTTTTTTLPPLPERAEVGVVVANGANIGGIASSTADALEELGYESVRATDGTEVVFFSIVYFVDGAEALALRMADDLELEPTSVAPIAEAPDILADFDDELLLVYLGSDQG